MPDTMTRQTPLAAPPPRRLCIYEISGDARDLVPAEDSGFLGLWLEDTWSYMFFDRPADALVAELVAGRDHLALGGRHDLTYEQWQAGQELASFAVGPLWVTPAWRPSPPATPGLLPVVLDPGLVFGDGLHPTTRHCLELLCAEARRGPLGSVLDLGAGTGLLSLAAARLGARPVTAVDLNPLCVTTTARNAALNDLDIQVRQGPAQDFLDPGASLVLANLPWAVQRELWPAWPESAPRPPLILSGILRGQVGPLEDLLRAAGWRVESRRDHDFTWFTLLARATDGTIGTKSYCSQGQ